MVDGWKGVDEIWNGSGQPCNLRGVSVIWIGNGGKAASDDRWV